VLSVQQQSEKDQHVYFGKHIWRNK